MRDLSTKGPPRDSESFTEREENETVTDSQLVLSMLTSITNCSMDGPHVLSTSEMDSSARGISSATPAMDVKDAGFEHVRTPVRTEAQVQRSCNSARQEVCIEFVKIHSLPRVTYVLDADGATAKRAICRQEVGRQAASA